MVSARLVLTSQHRYLLCFTRRSGNVWRIRILRHKDLTLMGELGTGTKAVCQPGMDLPTFHDAIYFVFLRYRSFDLCMNRRSFLFGQTTGKQAGSKVRRIRLHTYF